MDSLGNFSITALAELLKDSDNIDNDSDDDKPKGGIARMGPGDLKRRTTRTEDDSTKQATTKVTENSKDIWQDEEVPMGAEYDDVHDLRKQPEYDMVYKQDVSSEDMFLQMGSKNPSTSSCEDLIIKVKLPGTKFTDIILDVKETFFDCRTADYKLGLFLPHRVDANKTKAQWDADKQLLVVTLRLNREYDFMNF